MDKGTTDSFARCHLLTGEDELLGVFQTASLHRLLLDELTFGRNLVVHELTADSASSTERTHGLHLKLRHWSFLGQQELLDLGLDVAAQTILLQDLAKHGSPLLMCTALG